MTLAVNKIHFINNFSVYSLCTSCGQHKKCCVYVCRPKNVKHVQQPLYGARPINVTEVQQQV